MYNFDHLNIFETSWGVCNKTDAVHKILSEKAELMSGKFGNNYILIGPDVWREEKENPEFKEDKNLFKAWRKHAKNKDNMRFSVGRWNIKGNPVTILLDFSNFVPKKNKIFKSFWEKYKLDSLSGDWDYIKHAMFGYATGKLIESYRNFYLSGNSKVVSHFHDWKTGSGLLYLDYYLPNIATIFTIHFPVTAEAVANSGNDLHSGFQNADSYEIAKTYNIISKNSLEKTAANISHIFSVSNKFTADLCKIFTGKKPDLITSGLQAKKTKEPEFDKNKILENYCKEYDLALEKIKSVKVTFSETPKYIFKEVKTYKSNKPIWRTLSVKPEFSGKLNKLDELSKNLWWVWNPEACELFKCISGDNSQIACTDPISILKKITYEKFYKLEKDTDFIKKFDKVYNDFKNYMSKPYSAELPSVAYFSMEYGLTDILKIYSGGLGILAGDYFKQASDSGYDMTAVGLFYRQGYFKQQINVRGEQNAVYESQIFNDLPAEIVKDEKGNPLTVQIVFPGRNINIGIWKINVGRIKLYLLDTDREDNNKEDRFITYRLYGGDNENRLKQEMILGIGGIRALNILNIKKDIYHCNEGHAALIGLERINKLMSANKLAFSEALEIVRTSSLFTTHTPVPAGHDAFREDLIGIYMGHYPERLKISWKDFINLGKFRPGKENEKFSMSVFAVNTSQEINGVSKLHGEVSRNVIFNKLWDGYFPEELHIGYVTNGVHYPTWTAKEWQNILKNENNEPDFSKVNNISDEKIWEIRLNQKQQLVNYINTRLNKTRIKRQEDPKLLLKIKNTNKADILTIGFARRFAPYKRGDLIFNDLKRINKIINNSEMPVRFIFAGKAHPNDKKGQDIIKKVVEMTKRPEFKGKILFLENYNMLMAKHLVKGVDIWLNTPTRPLEASGTSGMKAVMNGVLNFSVLDGWWLEGYKKGAGWELPESKTYDNQEMQNDLDAEMIYQKLENEIIPLYYKRNENNIPCGWIKYVKKCISEIAPEFTTKRMIEDYEKRFYNKLRKRSKIITAENFGIAKELSSWKKKIEKNWDKIEVHKLNISDPVKDAITSGEKYYGKLVINIKNIEATDIGAEMLITEEVQEGERKIISVTPLEFIKYKNNKVHFSIKINPHRAGSFDYAFRIFPKHKHLPHRQDFSYVKWI